MSFPYTVPLSPKDAITPTSNQIHRLGTRGMTADGRVYYYAKNGTSDLSKGLLIQSEAGTNRWGDATQSYLSTSVTKITSTHTEIKLGTTRDCNLTITADTFKEGWLWVSSSSTEAGQMIKIKSHTASSSGTSNQICTVTIEDGYSLSQDVDTGSFVAMSKNEYDSVIVVPTAAATNMRLGASNSDVTDSDYFWLQTWGPCPMKSDIVLPAAADIWNSTKLAGSIDSVTATTGGNTTAKGPGKGAIGKMAGMAMTSNEFCLVHLTLSP